MGMYRKPDTAFGRFLTPRSFDNSGQKMDFPHWQSNQTNVDRTNAVIKQIVAEFSSQYQTATAIAPLNE